MKKLTKIAAAFIAVMAMGTNMVSLAASAAEEELFSAEKQIVLTESDYELLLDNGYSSRAEIDTVLASPLSTTSSGYKDYVIRVDCNDLPVLNGYEITTRVDYNPSKAVYYGSTASACATGSVTSNVVYGGTTIPVTNTCGFCPNGVIMYYQFGCASNVSASTCLTSRSVLGLTLLGTNQNAMISTHTSISAPIAIADVDQDGQITIADQLQIVYFISEQTSLLSPNFNSLAADVNLDGEITAQDGYYISQYLSGLNAHPWG